MKVAETAFRQLLMQTCAYRLCAYRLLLMLWLHTVEKRTEILTCVTLSYGFICLHKFSNRKHDFF